VQSNERYSQLYAAEQAVRHVERGWLGVNSESQQAKKKRCSICRMVR
jgi:hypothetical protein